MEREKVEARGGERPPFPDIEIDPRLVADEGIRTGEGARARAREEETAQRKGRWRGIWRGVKFLLSGPWSSVGVENITEGASYVRGLADSVRSAPKPRDRIQIYDDRTIDIEATAVNEGRSVVEIRAMMSNRRLQTKRAVLCYLGGAIGFFGVWLWEAVHSAAYARLPYVIVLALICSLFCLSAFYNALVNWQIRTLRLGTWREFLNTEDSWWPS